MGWIERTVWAVPALLDPAATFQGWVRDRQRYGPVYRDELAGILERDRWPAHRLAEYQRERLRELIERAATHVPWYREVFRDRGIDPASIRDPSDLRAVPVLEKETLRTTPERLVDEGLDPGDLVGERTTGTTGTPVQVYKTSDFLQASYAYFEGRCRRPAGLAFRRRPYVMVGAQDVVPQTRERPPFWCYNYRWKQLYMSAFHLAPRFLEAYCRELARRPYHAIMGYPSSLYVLARYVREHGIDEIAFETAITSGEMLYREQREFIEEAFGCRVFDQYGCSENCVFGAECGHGSMHLSPEVAVVEVVDDDDRPVPAGESGQLLCTGLLNFGQPLIRYRVGDRGALASEPCPCGSPLPVLARLDGRGGCNLITADGRFVSRLSRPLKDVPHARGYQVIQEAIGRFRVRVAVTDGFSDDEARQVRANLAADVGEAEIAVEPVDRIEPGPGGKVLLTICRVADERIVEDPAGAPAGDAR